jgi:hypothetical protein
MIDDQNLHRTGFGFNPSRSCTAVRIDVGVAAAAAVLVGSSVACASGSLPEQPANRAKPF